MGRGHRIEYEGAIYLTEEKVVAILGLDGKIAAIRGDAKETSDTIYGVVTYAKVEKEGSLSLFNKEGKVVDYTAAKRTTLSGIKDSDSGLNYYGEADKDLKYAIAEFKLNRDGEISDDDFKAVVVEKDNLPTVKDADKQYAGEFTKKDDKAYFELGSDDFYISKSTVIISAINKNELDPKVISYDDLVKMSVDKEKAVVFGDKGKNAKLIVFLKDGFKGYKETYYFGVVTDDPWTGRKTTTVEMNVAGSGKAEYKLDKTVDFVKGNVVAFTLNSKDEAIASVAGTVYNKKTTSGIEDGLDKDKAILVKGLVEKTSGSFVTVGGTPYKFASDAVIYDFKLDGGKFKLDGTARMSRINEDDYVMLVVDVEAKEVKAAAVYYDKDLQKF